jgi:hypothetical protein
MPQIGDPADCGDAGLKPRRLGVTYVSQALQ